MSGEVEKELDRLKKMVYPYYGISELLNQIILFTGPKTGVNINGKGWPVGKTSEEWNERSFIPYYGEIRIVNGRINFFCGIEVSKRHWGKENK